jgi:hypothetical protein
VCIGLWIEIQAQHVGVMPAMLVFCISTPLQSVNGCYIDIACFGSQQKAQWAPFHEAFRSKE